MHFGSRAFCATIVVSAENVLKLVIRGVRWPCKPSISTIAVATGGHDIFTGNHL